MSRFNYNTSRGINKPYLFKKLRLKQVFKVAYLLAGYGMALVAVCLLGVGLITLLVIPLYTALFIFYVRRAIASNSHPDMTYLKAKAAYQKQPKALYDFHIFLRHITHEQSQ
ncbi:MAG: hypothetical protein MI674_01575 [Cytophagales bacterium]|nr:hypothetical protein [Cytophagales bacterium]